MKLAVISDIHSNYLALEKCVNYAVGQGVRDFLFLGDYIGEMAYPEKTMELLYRYKERYNCIFVRGNKEEYWLEHRDGTGKEWQEYSSTTGALFYASQHLSEEDLTFFESMPIATRVEFPGLPTILACHGSPFYVKEAIRPENGNVAQILDASGAEYLACGHTHIQTIIENRGRIVLNPGSAGLALQGGGKAEFAILHGKDGRWSEELISLDYDRERTIRELSTSGLAQKAPYWCMITSRLLQPMVSELREVGHAEVLFRAMDLCRRETGDCVWPMIPERFWEQAVREFKIY